MASLSRRLCRVLLACAALLGATLSAAAPVENSGGRPPQGFARPPFHVRGNATRSPMGFSPSQVRQIYGFDQLSQDLQGAGQTIAIVDAYDNPNAESDLNTFSVHYGLPSCTSNEGCFRQIYSSRKKPRADAGWALEISLDVQWAHAMAPKAKILLVEAPSASFTDLMHAVDVAVQNGASVISMSWGANEFFFETGYDSHFNVMGVTFTAASGDSGNGVEYPAASPGVVSVGGTSVNVNSSGNFSETAWSGSGGGQSRYEAEPSYQSSYPIPGDPNGVRGVPDVAYLADPSPGFAVYDSYGYMGQSGWFAVGGTSAGAPQWAALFAIANGARALLGKGTLSGTDTAVYNAARGAYDTNFRDVTSGSNGNCGALCSAGTGYDYVTGLGAPRTNSLIQALISAP